MNSPIVEISSTEVMAASNDRFHRFGLIEWWRQDRLRQAKILVIGAGALGNEIVKNLALLGVGNVVIVDLDRVENSNLSRSVLFRPRDNGKFKADVAALAAKEIYPDMRVVSIVANVVHDVGLGLFRWADIVLAGLDNREARLAINRNCWRVNRPWIDGAIEQIQGCVRVFVPDGPCYECTMSAIDWQLLRRRRSCNLLSRAEMEEGRTPTTPTVSSIIAGVQCQEAVKFLHGMPTIAGRGWVFDGHSTDAYQIELQRKDDCYSHDVLDEIVRLPVGVNDWTVSELASEVHRRFGPDAEFELARDILEKLVCPNCRDEEHPYVSLGKATDELAYCRKCPGIRREVVTFYKLDLTGRFGHRTLQQLGVPEWDIGIVRAGDRSVGIEFGGDEESVLRCCVDKRRDT